MHPFAVARSKSSAGYEVENSVRLDDNSSAYMSKTFSGAADSTTTYTLSLWFKRGNISLGATTRLLTANGVSDMTIGILSDDTLTWSDQETDAPYDTWYLTTTQVLRDPAAWYNLVLCFDSTNGTAGNRMRMWLNGVEVTDFDTDTNPDLNANSAMGSAIEHFIGSWNASLQYFDGYISEFVYLDGAAVTDATDFGEFDDQSEWRPKDVTGLTFGANGFLQTYSVAPGTGNGAGTDVSGNANHFTDSGLTAADQVSDTPTDVHATWNSINLQSSLTLSDGNLKWVNAAASERQPVSTLKMTSNDKMRVEHTVDANTVTSVGIRPVSATSNLAGSSSAITLKNRNDGYGYVSSGEKVELSTDTTSAGATWTNGDVIALEYDGTTGELECFKWVTSAFVSQFTITGIDTGIDWVWCADGYSNGSITSDFGQLGFAETPTEGFTATSTANMTAASIAYDDEIATAQDTEDDIESSLATARSGWSNYVDFYLNRDTGEARLVRFSHDSSNEHAFSTTDTHQAKSTLSGTDNWYGRSFKVDGNAKIRAGAQAHTNGAGDTSVSFADVGTTRYMVLLFGRAGGLEVVQYHPDLTSGDLYHLTAITNPAADSAIKNFTSTGFDIDTGEATDTYDYLVLPESEIIAHGIYDGNSSANGPLFNHNIAPEEYWQFSTDVSGGMPQLWYFNELETNGNPRNTGFSVGTVSAETSTHSDLDCGSNFAKLRTTHNYYNGAFEYIYTMIGRPSVNKSETPAKAR